MTPSILTTSKTAVIDNLHRTESAFQTDYYTENIRELAFHLFIIQQS